MTMSPGDPGPTDPTRGSAVPPYEGRRDSADVDGDSQPELCVLSKEHEYGTGDDSYFATDCYHRTADKFELIEALAPLSIGLKNAKAVRQHFAKHPVKPGTPLPGSTSQ